MSRFLRVNFAEALLSEAISDNAATIKVVTGHSLPTAVGKMRLATWDAETYPNPADDPQAEFIEAEYSGTPNIYNVLRAQEGTSAYAHAALSRVAMHYTAGVSEADLSILGTKEVNEAAIADKSVLTYDENTNKLVYKKVLSDLPDGLLHSSGGIIKAAQFDAVLGSYII